MNDDEKEEEKVELIRRSKTPLRRLNISSINDSAIEKRKEEVGRYLNFISEDEFLMEFLNRDVCCRYADRYLLAVVYTYFHRIRFTKHDRIHFFAALYLAHEMEEEDPSLKWEIFPWALGKEWSQKMKEFIFLKNNIWKLMNFRAIVSRKCCEEVIALNPRHFLWRRIRNSDHGGAFRDKNQGKQYIPLGPFVDSPPCPICFKTDNTTDAEEISVDLDDFTKDGSNDSFVTVTSSISLPFRKRQKIEPYDNMELDYNQISPLNFRGINPKQFVSILTGAEI